MDNNQNIKVRVPEVNFDNHILTIIKESENTTIYDFKIPNTVCERIKFINTNGLLVVTGDYGNWLFCREFHPSPTGSVSSHYWVEKMQYASCQDPKEYSAEDTAEDIQERLNELEEDGYTGEQLQAMRSYYEDCLRNVDDFYEYIQSARDYPSFVDSEGTMIIRKRLNIQLEIVFDAFDEICRRMKAEKENNVIGNDLTESKQ